MTDEIDVEALVAEILHDVRIDEETVPHVVMLISHPSSDDYEFAVAQMGTYDGTIRRDDGTLAMLVRRDAAIDFVRSEAREDFADEIAANQDPRVFFVVTFANGDGVALTEVVCEPTNDATN